MGASRLQRQCDGPPFSLLTLHSTVQHVLNSGLVKQAAPSSSSVCVCVCISNLPLDSLVLMQHVHVHVYRSVYMSAWGSPEKSISWCHHLSKKKTKHRQLSAYFRRVCEACRFDLGALWKWLRSACLRKSPSSLGLCETSYESRIPGVPGALNHVVLSDSSQH